MLDLICTECCHPRPERHTSKCTIGLADLFKTIFDRLPDLTHEKQRAQLGDSGGPGGFESCPPINLHNYAMQSHASKVDPIGPDDTGPLPLYVLWEWEAAAARAGGDWQDGKWVVEQPWIGDMVADLRTIAVQLRSATGDPPPRPIGKCQRTLGLGERELIVCGEPLYMPETPIATYRAHEVTVWDCPTVRCPRPECREEYTGAALLRLKLIADRERRYSRSGLVTSVEGPRQRIADPCKPGTGPMWDGSRWDRESA
ncbi:MAG TPA: hypothetical protein VKA83_22220 [Methylomirabilota bacterium]|nr:hypothetical protein [Methylomirabilota bacterium]